MQQKYVDVRVERVNETFVIHTGRGSVLAQTLRNTVMGRYSPRTGGRLDAARAV